MPIAPKKPCSIPSCRNLTTDYYCPSCLVKINRQKKIKYKKYNRQRGSASKRGYNYKWQKESRAYLALPENTCCAICSTSVRPVPSECVDHIIPHKGDMILFWDKSNWQPACKRCNTIKAIKEEGAFGR